MQISSTRRKVINQQAIQEGQGQNSLPQENTLSSQIVDSLVNSPDFSKKALSKLGAGGTMTINVNGSDVITIKNESPGIAQRVLDGGGQIMTRASQEVVRAMNADPAFAFKLTARAAQEGV
jgi:hypothetical protein